MSIEPKSTVALVLKNGVQVSTQCSSNPQEVEDSYNRARRDETGELRLCTGDDANNIIRVVANECVLFSVRNFVDEKLTVKQDKENGLILPPRRLQ